MPAKPTHERSFVKGSGPSGGALRGYARVSKEDEQNNTLQIKLREGDILVVWKLDRLSRLLKDVLHIMERIANADTGFRSIAENIDTTTPAGRMMTMQMVGAFAEFERAMIREQTSAGLAAAKAEGTIGGRRKKLDTSKRRKIAESVVSGRKCGAEMARLYGVSQPTVSRIVARTASGSGNSARAF